MPDIAFWNKCNSKCIMCTNMDSFVNQDSMALYGIKHQIKMFERHLIDGGTYLKNPQDNSFLSLTGGEPTLHPDFFKLIAYFRRRVPSTRIVLLSNARKFSNLTFVKKFIRVAKPPFEIACSLHGSRAAKHEAITQAKGSFNQALKGIENILKFSQGQRLEIRIVLIKQNIKDFENILRLFLRKFPDTAKYRIVVIHYEIEGMSLINHKKIALDLKESSKVVNKCFKLIKQFADFRLYHFPLCVLNSRLREYAWITLPMEDRIYIKECRKCSQKKKCLGLMRTYYEHFGGEEIHAL
ncbi:MAG: radical SAM protein [Elusimicrobiales bacterium]|nr:radical SAM protein [Elusimicrobiales bacterium]